MYITTKWRTGIHWFDFGTWIRSNKFVLGGWFPGTFHRDFCQHVYIWLNVHSCWPWLISCLSLFFWVRLHRSLPRGVPCVSTLAFVNSSTRQTTSSLSCLSLFAQVLQAQLLQIPSEMAGTSDVTCCVADAWSEKPTTSLGYHISWEFTTVGFAPSLSLLTLGWDAPFCRVPNTGPIEIWQSEHGLALH